MLRSFKSVVSSSLFALFFLPTLVSAGGITVDLDLGPTESGFITMDESPEDLGGTWCNGTTVYVPCGWRCNHPSGYFAQDNRRSGPSAYSQVNWEGHPSYSPYVHDGWRSGPNVHSQVGGGYPPNGHYVQGGWQGDSQWQGSHSGGPVYRTDHPGQAFHPGNPQPSHSEYFDDRDGDGKRDPDLDFHMR